MSMNMADDRSRETPALWISAAQVQMGPQTEHWVKSVIKEELVTQNRKKNAIQSFYTSMLFIESLNQWYELQS